MEIYANIMQHSSEEEENLNKFYEAIGHGSLEEILALINEGMDVNALFRCGNTPLLEAIERGDISIIDLLLNNGAKINNPNPDLPLRRAVIWNSWDIIKLLIQRGATVTNSIIRNVIAERNLELLKLFFANDNTININSNSENERSILCTAIHYEHYEITNFLLMNGADANINESEPIKWAAKFCCKGGDLIKLLLRYKAAVPKDILLYAIHDYFDLKVIQLLIDNGADPNACNEDNIYPLHKAMTCFRESINENLDLMKILVENGADTSLTILESSYLHYAVEVKAPEEVIDFLVTYNPNLLNALNKYNETPLELAIESIVHQFSSYGVSEYFKSHNELITSFLIDRAIAFKCLGHYICKNNLKYIRNKKQIMVNMNGFTEKIAINSRKLKEFYELEVKKLKNTKLYYNSSFTLYDILTSNKNTIFESLKKEEMKMLLSSQYLKSQFPMYFSIINWRIKFGFNERYMLDGVHWELREIFDKVKELPYDCTEKILNYFTSKDIKFLFEAFNK